MASGAAHHAVFLQEPPKSGEDRDDDDDDSSSEKSHASNEHRRRQGFASKSMFGKLAYDRRSHHFQESDFYKPGYMAGKGEDEDKDGKHSKTNGTFYGVEFDDDSFDNGFRSTGQRSQRTQNTTTSDFMGKESWKVSDKELLAFIEATRLRNNQKDRLSVIDRRRQVMKNLPFPNFECGAPIRLDRLERSVQIPCRQTGRRSHSALDERFEIMVSMLRFQLKVECYNDTLVGGGPTSLKGLVEGATGLDPRAMRFYFLKCPMHTDDRTVSSYGIGNNAIVALRMANVSEPDLRPSLRQTLLTVGPSRRQTLLNSRPEKWLEDKAAGLKSAKDSILSDEVKLVQKWSTLPAGIHNSPLERMHDNRQASELIYMKDFSHVDTGGGQRPYDGLTFVRENIAKTPKLLERKAGAASGLRTLEQSIRVMANMEVPKQDVFKGWRQVRLEREHAGGKQIRAGSAVWNRISPGARNVLPGGDSAV